MRRRAVCGLHLGLDHFKDVNDIFGTSVGDAVLHRVASRLLGAVRANDRVARLGNDKFAVLQSGVNSATDAGIFAWKLLSLINEAHAADGKQLHLTASIGIAGLETDGADAQRVLAEADLALYRAKADGGARVAFHIPALDEAVRARVALTEQLGAAVTNNQLELLYQPQVALATGQLLGLEALLRWNQPEPWRLGAIRLHTTGAAERDDTYRRQMGA